MLGHQPAQWRDSHAPQARRSSTVAHGVTARQQLEFAAAARDAAAAAARRAADELDSFRETVARTPIESGQGAFHVTPSIGCTRVNQSLSLHDLMTKADKALYQAKSTGRNKVVLAVEPK